METSREGSRNYPFSNQSFIDSSLRPSYPYPTDQLSFTVSSLIIHSFLLLSNTHSPDHCFLRATPHRVAVSGIKQVAAGSYHTVLLHRDGHVLTCGSNKVAIVSVLFFCACYVVLCGCMRLLYGFYVVSCGCMWLYVVECMHIQRSSKNTTTPFQSGQLGRATASRESCYTPTIVPAYGGCHCACSITHKSSTVSTYNHALS